MKNNKVEKVIRTAKCMGISEFKEFLDKQDDITYQELHMGKKEGNNVYTVITFICDFKDCSTTANIAYNEDTEEFLGDVGLKEFFE